MRGAFLASVYLSGALLATMNGDADALTSKERKQDQPPTATVLPEEASSTTTPLIPPPAPTVPPTTLTGLTKSTSVTYEASCN